MRVALALVVLSLVVTIPPTASAASHTVSASNFQWTPSSLSAQVGDTVLFKNNGGTHALSSSSLGSCSLPCTKTLNTAGTFSYVCTFHSSMTGSVTVGSTPVLNVTNPAPGASVTTSFVADGTAFSPGATITSVTVRIGTGSDQPATLTPSGGGKAWTRTVDVSNLANGIYTVTIRATNNIGTVKEATRSVQVANPETRDLILSSLTSGTSLTGQPTLTLVVQNSGTIPSGGYHVLVEYFYEGEWNRIAEPAEPSIAGKSTTTIAIPWSDGKLHVGRYQCRVTIDSLGEVVEVDESTNHVRTVFASWYTSLVNGVDP